MPELPASSGDWRWLELLERSLDGEWDRVSELKIEGRSAWVPTADDIPLLLGISMSAQMPERTTRSRSRQTLRRSLGSFQTPRPWSDALAEDAVTTWSATYASRQPPSVIDPACGAGSLLLALLRRLRTEGYSIPDMIRRGLVVGVDVDERAVRACRCALCLLEPDAGLRPSDSALQNIQMGDALSLMTLRRDFEIAVLNPPFINAVEHGVDMALKRWLAVAYSEVGGTANLAGYFLALATVLTAPRGIVSALVPRTLLQARPMKAWRASLTPGVAVPLRSLRRLRLPDSGAIFSGADVFICLLTIGPGAGLVVSESEFPTLPDWCDATGRLTHADWWACVTGHAGPATVQEFTDSRQFTDEMVIRASLTTDDFYRIRPHVVDGGAGQRLVTTGLIAPGECLWGLKRCRYLGDYYMAPTLAPSVVDTSPSVRRNLLWSKRPKVLVAGLGRRLECFVDRDGVYIGAVSTWSIYRSDDDLSALEALSVWLMNEQNQRKFELYCGASALSGGSKSVRRDFVVLLLEEWCRLPRLTKLHT
jgi:hypothetical protein